jgi:hypothetical protein
MKQWRRFCFKIRRRKTEDYMSAVEWVHPTWISDVDRWYIFFPSSDIISIVDEAARKMFAETWPKIFFYYTPCGTQAL